MIHDLHCPVSRLFRSTCTVLNIAADLWMGFFRFYYGRLFVYRYHNKRNNNLK